MVPVLPNNVEGEKTILKQVLMLYKNVKTRNHFKHSCQERILDENNYVGFEVLSGSYENSHLQGYNTV